MENKETQNCKLHIMPTPITDNDITALFNGVVNVVKKKFELETKSEIISINSNLQKTLNKLKEKEAECIRLKNEIIFLRSELDNLKK